MDRVLLAFAAVGRRGQWVLATGVVAALVLPGPGAILKPTLPFWVALLFGLAMTRIDLAMVLRRAVMPRRLIRNLGFCALLMGVTPALFWAGATLAGLPSGHVSALVYTSAAPPLGSAAAFCLLLGLDAAFALEMSVLGSMLAPLTMPIVSRLLLGEAVPLDTFEMTARLGLLLGSGAVGAVIARRLLGALWIEKNRTSFDGLSVVILIVFLFPLFDGMTAVISAFPMLALGTFLLVVLANLGVQVASFPLNRLVTTRQTAGAASLVWGNRNAALALAALPPDPLLTLYVALYQFPMYFTPLLMRPIVGRLDRDQID